MSQAKYSAWINGQKVEGSLEITKEIIWYLHNSGTPRFRAKDVEQQFKLLKDEWQIEPSYQDDTHANLHALCVNSNSQKHYSNQQNFLWLIDRGLFEIYQPFSDASIQALEDDIVEIEQRREEGKIEQTEAETLIKARKGQGRFRKEVLSLYPRCPVSGIEMPSLLIASHIKPWHVCDDKERLDKFNGLMLSPNIDALFDNGLITIDINGTIQISTLLTLKNQNLLGINSDMKLEHLHQESQKYLQWHREKVFRK